MRALPLLLILLALPAHAAVFGTVPTQSGRIDLHDEKGACEGDAMRAEFVSLAGRKVGGCWVVIRGGVQVAFLDGDAEQIPTAAIKRPETI